MNRRMIDFANYTLNHDIYPETVSVTYDSDDEFLPEAERNAKQAIEFLLAQTVEIPNDAKFVGLVRFTGCPSGNIFNRQGHFYNGKFLEKYYLKSVDDLVIGEWEHSNADFGEIIRNGIEGVIARINAAREKFADDPERLFFLKGAETVCFGIISWANLCADRCEALARNTADEARKAELTTMGAILRRVPQKPARTFREAMQCLYLCFHFLPDSIGAPDRYLREYYEKDLAGGRITTDEAEDMIAELLTMISAFTPYTSPNFDKGGESHFAIGGYLPDHSDGYCGLSRLILDTMMKLPLVRPQVTVRWTPDMPYDEFYHIMDCERNDKGKRIAVCNDVPRIHAFEQYLDLPFEEACKYIVVGCNEPSFEGAIDITGANANIGLSMAQVFEKRREQVIRAKDFDEFYTIYEEVMCHDLDRIIELVNRFNAMRAQDINVLSSPFLSGCIERARSANAGGCDRATFCPPLAGYITVVDSLAIVKQFVYDGKTFTMEKLCDMLRANWEGYEDERRMILKKGMFFGNDIEQSNAMVERLNASLHRYAKTRRSVLGSKVIFGTYNGYWQHNAWLGEKTGATPDGRYHGEPFVLGVGQTGGKDVEGMTSLLNSAVTAFADGAVNGSVVFNLMLDDTLVHNDDNFPKTVKLLDAYFRKGGLMLQLNYVSREELVDAQKHPENYKGLRVRVSGFSAYFTNLNETLQKDIIARTSYSK